MSLFQIITKSQKGRDGKGPTSTPLHKGVPARSDWLGLCPVRFEYLWGWMLHNLSRQPQCSVTLTVSFSIFFCTFKQTPCISVCSHCCLFLHWAWLRRSLLEPYLFQVEQSQLSQTLPTWHMLQSLTHLSATQIVTDRPLLLAAPTYIATKAHIKSTDSRVLFLLSSWPGLKLTSENTHLYSLNLQVHSYSQLLCISAWPLRTCNTIFRLWVL